MSYIIKSGNQYVGIDSHSGGYPYITKHLTGAKIWTDKKEVKRYCDMFREQAEDEEWILFEIQLKRVFFSCYR